MKPVLFYILQVIVASGLLYCYYHFALRNKKFHRYNRFYLLMAVLISSFIPFLKIPVYFSEETTQASAVFKTLNVISSPSIDIESPVTQIDQVQTQSSPLINADNILYIIYFIIVSFLIVRILLSINKIKSITKKYPVEQFDKIRFVNTDEPGTPFSFFRWLFWNRKIELNSEKGEQIFRHELFHIQQKHSWDIIFIEVISTVFWINPFFHLIKKEIKAIHEFLADEFAIKENKNWEYAELLLMQALNTNTHLVNPFFHNQIKRRIAMITLSKKPSYQYLRKIMVLPIATLIVALFAFTYKNKSKNADIEFEKAINSITVVVDPGHAGESNGATSSDKKYNEANLTFEIAKMIQSLGPEYNVNVIMTREDNDLNKRIIDNKESLMKTVDLLNMVNPQAFIAIHLNTTSEKEQNSRSGIDGYVTKQRYNLPDIELATIVLKELKTIYTTKQEIKQRQDKGIFLLDNATCPSLLLECGYINNPKDLSFITDKGNQEKVARAILKGLVSFANEILVDSRPDSKNSFLQNDTIPNVNGVLFINKLEPFKKQSPSSAQLNSWTDGKIYGVWMDGKRIDNAQLKNYSSSDFSHFYVSKLTKSAINYGKHYYQVDLMTNDYYQNYLKTFDYDRQIKFLIHKDTVPGVLKKYKDYLIAVDGVIKDRNCLDTMPADMIRSIAILKDKSAIDKYGEKGRNGVIEITTKPKIDSIEIYYNDPNSQKIKEIILTDTTTRPQPLVVLNGKPRPDLSIKDLNMISPEHIRAILMGDTAIKKYGNIAKNGAIEINTEYSKDGVTIKEVILESPQAINKTDPDNKIFSKVEVEAAFPGGVSGWRKFLYRYLDANSIEKSGCKPGTYTVVMQFIVHKDGHITDVKALTSQGYGMEEQCIRIISKSPNWIPAKRNGKNVTAYRKQPITFVIASKISDMNKTGFPVNAYLISSNETPTIKLADLKKVTQLKLQKIGAVQNYELMSFRITVDQQNSEGSLKDFVIKGSDFSKELIKMIDELNSETLITIEDIDVKIDGQQRRLPPKIYKATIITTIPG